ncbi:hypothetical protein ACIQUG_21790 [Ensifer sp. NPDC090286]|uniref:hypothetical protein n=1 Tax=Ensifer sp. NPDC090286 TaxID=3363991 RepID=UPI003839EC35
MFFKPHSAHVVPMKAGALLVWYASRKGVVLPGISALWNIDRKRELQKRANYKGKPPRPIPELPDR